MSTDAVRSGGSAAVIPLRRRLAALVAEPPAEPPTRAPSARAAAAGLALAFAVAAAVLLWSKWLPYSAAIARLTDTPVWTGRSVLTAGGVQPGDAPSWSAATSFVTTYLGAVWKAMLAALLISAAVQAFVPAGWLPRLLNRTSAVRSAVAGGLASTPSMMCTCCTAPVAATLRRDGVGTAGAVAYWLGNPLLNPAVLVFLALVAPWQWTLTRAVVGVLVVVGGSALVARLAARPEVPPEQLQPGERQPAGCWWAGALRRFRRTLLRLCVTLVPEYLVVVLAIGACRGWLLLLGGSPASTGVAVVVVAAAIGTLLVIPTGGEIPILQGLALAGLSLGGVGALLLTLPAVSLPGMVMVVRSFGWRATCATAAVVAGGGLLAGGMLMALPA